MNNVQSRPTIVVGVSGSAASAGALRWAADETGRRGGQLKAVLIWRAEPRAYYAPPVSAPDAGARQRQAGDQLAATVEVALGHSAQGSISMQVAEGSAERALVELSAGADLLVLGSEPGHLADRSLGPVVRTCLSRAHCPVVVVRPEGPADDGPAAQPDGGVASEREDLALQLTGGSPAARR